MGTAEQPVDHVEIYGADDGSFRWRAVVEPGGETTFENDESFETRGDAINAVLAARSSAVITHVHTDAELAE